MQYLTRMVSQLNYCEKKKDLIGSPSELNIAHLMSHHDLNGEMYVVWNYLLLQIYVVPLQWVSGSAREGAMRERLDTVFAVFPVPTAWSFSFPSPALHLMGALASVYLSSVSDASITEIIPGVRSKTYDYCIYLRVFTKREQGKRWGTSYALDSTNLKYSFCSLPFMAHDENSQYKEVRVNPATEREQSCN